MNRNTPLIIEQSRPGRVGVKLPDCDVPDITLEDRFPLHLLRSQPAHLPQVTEPEVVRHFTNLSQKNHHVDRDFYPLGSCTMKYNPKINDLLAGLPGFAGLHPLQDDDAVQGALQIIWELEQMLMKMTGMAG
ncbi:MAG: aminomethyl-transferring glycine dehydrogenase subunit GcvPB, partial [FCB group bacterium]|nr:aminomethyl-transferring glycine dehydrogenase subunit GcvPB [FCB group bacterium]